MWKVIYYLNLALYTILLISTSFLAVLIAIVCSLTGRRLNTNYFVARTFYCIAGTILGWKFQVEGEQYLWELSGEHGGGKANEKGRSMVMVGNHQRCVPPCRVAHPLGLNLEQLRRHSLLGKDLPQTCRHHG